MKRFVHLGINPLGAMASVPGSGNPPNFYVVLEGDFNRFAPDWYRYGGQNYVVWTDANLTEIALGVKAPPGFQHVYVLASELTPAACDGMMPVAFWQWLEKTRY